MSPEIGVSVRRRRSGEEIEQLMIGYQSSKLPRKEFCRDHRIGMSTAGPQRLSQALARPLSRHGAATGARPAGAAELLQPAPPSVEKAAHHRHHRALLRRSPTPYPPHGMLCQRSQCRPNHLFDLPPLQPGMENPHPPSFYTSSLTSPE